MSGVSFSVIVPVHPDPIRQAETLPRAVASVQAQRYQAMEIIQVRGMTNTEAKNYGAAQASGDWLAFLDDDDYWFPNTMELVAGNAYKADCITGNYHTLAGVQVSHARMLQLLGSGMVFTGCSGLFIKRDTFNSLGGFDETLTTSDILEFLLRIVHSGTSILHLPESLYYKEFKRGDNLTFTRTREELDAERALILSRYP